MRAILMFHNCEGQSHKTDRKLWRERRAEADSNRGPSAYQPNALPVGSLKYQDCINLIVIVYLEGNDAVGLADCELCSPMDVNTGNRNSEDRWPWGNRDGADKGTLKIASSLGLRLSLQA